jgi:SAM-dependent methyltransferase
VSQVILHSTRCTICGTEGNAAEIYPANFDFSDFNPEIFSARRLPDRIHCRMVRCNACGLVRSDPVADATTLGELYRHSTFEYGAEVANLRRTYGRYLDKLDAFGVRKGSLLEIGCGNGFFIEEALTRGFSTVRGVEPSQGAVAKAAPQVRGSIVCDVMRPGLFEQGQFDVICMFQVLDHLPDPGGTLKEVHRVLKPGGFVLILNHNINAISARLLGERSPIIDIEHTYLYDRRTLRLLFIGANFAVQRVGMAWNSYSLEYLWRLFPMSVRTKNAVSRILKWTGIGKQTLSVPLGNMWLIASRKMGNGTAS